MNPTPTLLTGGTPALQIYLLKSRNRVEKEKRRLARRSLGEGWVFLQKTLDLVKKLRKGLAINAENRYVTTDK